jgi:hypothetical protein
MIKEAATSSSENVARFRYLETTATGSCSQNRSLGYNRTSLVIYSAEWRKMMLWPREWIFRIRARFTSQHAPRQFIWDSMAQVKSVAGCDVLTALLAWFAVWP